MPEIVSLKYSTSARIFWIHQWINNRGGLMTFLSFKLIQSQNDHTQIGRRRVGDMGWLAAPICSWTRSIYVEFRLSDLTLFQLHWLESGWSPVPGDNGSRTVIKRSQGASLDPCASEHVWGTSLIECRVGVYIVHVVWSMRRTNASDLISPVNINPYPIPPCWPEGE